MPEGCDPLLVRYIDHLGMVDVVAATLDLEVKNNVVVADELKVRLAEFGMEHHLVVVNELILAEPTIIESSQCMGIACIDDDQRRLSLWTR